MLAGAFGPDSQGKVMGLLFHGGGKEEHVWIQEISEGSLGITMPCDQSQWKTINSTIQIGLLLVPSLQA